MAKQGVTFTEDVAQRLVNAMRWVEGQGVDLTSPPRTQRPRAVIGVVKFGRPFVAFSSGTTVELVQTDVDGNDLADRDYVTCHLAPDGASVAADYATTDILRYLAYATPDASGVAGVVIGGVGRPYAVFPVDLTQVGGSQGTDAAAASWTYDVKDMDGTTLAAAANPTTSPHRWTRPDVGQMRKATAGTAHRKADGTLVIDWINEVAEQEDC